MPVTTPTSGASGGRQHLGGEQPAANLEHDVGERATDIHREPHIVFTCRHLVGPSTYIFAPYPTTQIFLHITIYPGGLVSLMRSGSVTDPAIGPLELNRHSPEDASNWARR